MTPADTDHFGYRIGAELHRLIAIAKLARTAAATLSLDWPRTPAKDALIEHYELNEPVNALRRYAAQGRMLERHGSPADAHDCPPERDSRWCVELLDLADSLGMSTEECSHCHDDPPAGHTCPRCGRRAKAGVS